MIEILVIYLHFHKYIFRFYFFSGGKNFIRKNIKNFIILMQEQKQRHGNVPMRTILPPHTSKNRCCMSPVSVPRRKPI